MMQEAIKNFAEQFKYEPKMEGSTLPLFSKYIVVGMGGSHLAGDLIKTRKPELDITIYSDYGLPACASKDTLVIVSSYSGNTEEVLSAFKEAQKRQLPSVAIATGEKLIALAKVSKVPYIQLPDIGIQPRSALGYSIKAITFAMGQKDLLVELLKLAELIKPLKLEQEGRDLSLELKNKVPIIYASNRNQSIAYNWKIKFNETGKIPAFYNIVPELNHNEMTGFDVADSSRALSNNFYFIFIKDDKDGNKIKKRFEILEKLYTVRGLSVKSFNLSGKSQFHKIFNSLIIADWTAVYTARSYGLESEQVPMVEEFKKMI